MDLNNIIPQTKNWSYNKGIIYYRKLQRLPICIFIDDIPHIVLENKIPRQLIELTKNFMISGQEFYFTSPLSSNPAGVFDFKNEVIKSYFRTYSNKKLHHGFKKINFDLIKNLIDWSEKNDAWYLVKTNYEEINKEIQREHYDYWKNKEYYDYDDDIREDFRTLWRDIQINKII